MSIYGEDNIISGAAGQAAAEGLARRTKANAAASSIRFFERQAVKSMKIVSRDTSDASHSYKVSISATARRLTEQRAGISTAMPR
ncbi:MAG: hypothetical protein HQL57_06620 [Magnetococcales bacterium]|nr:hypothetical protein [Magnetococcales bacterium]MBF0156844.1 hypothetical protein [Magnetococcales bacterium]